MSAAFAIRDAMNDIAEAPGKVWFWELERAVIDADRCIQCGACIAACPSDSLGIGPDDLPKLVKMCTGCSLCWDFCPRGGLRYEALAEVIADTPSGATWTSNGEASPNGHAALPETRVIPRDEESRRSDMQDRGGPRFFAGAQNDTPSANGHHHVNGNGNGHRHDTLDVARERYTARVLETVPGAQDGGVVSALLIE